MKTSETNTKRSLLSRRLQSAGIVALAGEGGIAQNDAKGMLPTLVKANEKFAPIDPGEGWEEIPG